jgi:DNA polymerase-3 subunit epsilon
MRLRAEVSALSAALAELLRHLLRLAGPAAEASLTVSCHGRAVQIEAAVEGTAPPADLEQALEAPVAVGPAARLGVREIVRRHAGEGWGWSDAPRIGFRVTLPLEEVRETAGPEVAPSLAVGFVGAGTRSGADPAAPPPPRPELYDFSFFDEMVERVRPADRARALEDLYLVVLDVETTGLRPEAGDAIVSLAGVRVRRGVVKRSEVFDALVKPGVPIPPASVRFHGITDAMVVQAPPIEVVLPAFLRFAEGAVLVGHEVWLDLRFLGQESRRLGLPPLSESAPVLDTRLLAEVVHPSADSHHLDPLAARLGVAIEGRHSALGDALATAEIFVRLLPLLRKRGIVTLGQALEATRAVPRPLSGARATGGAYP